MITFPVRPYPIDQDGRPLKPGTPRRAVACHCERPLVDVQTDTCVRCGHLPEGEIDATWQARAALIAARSRRRGLKAAA